MRPIARYPLTITNEISRIEMLKIDPDHSDQEEARRALEDGDLDYVLVIPLCPAEGGARDGACRGEAVRARCPVALLGPDDVLTYQLVEGVLRQAVDSLNLQFAGALPLIAVAPQAYRFVRWTTLMWC